MLARAVRSLQRVRSFPRAIQSVWSPPRYIASVASENSTAVPARADIRQVGVKIKAGQRVLLHSCCAPCSGAMIKELQEQGITLTVYFYNPNIHPRKVHLLLYLATILRILPSAITRSLRAVCVRNMRFGSWKMSNLLRSLASHS